MKELHGVIAATVIPYLPDERAPAGLRVAVDRYEEHCRWLVRSGCSGVVVNSSMGESGSLTVRERRTVTRAAVRALEGSADVVVGVHGGGGHQVAERANHAAEDGADAVMCLPPLGYEPTFSEVLRHFGAVAEVGVPLVVCNDPWICQVDLTPEMLAEITTLDNVVAVCDFSGEPERTWRTAALVPEVVVMTGTDRTVVENVISGARAWVAALPNLWPEQAVRLFDLVASGHLAQAQALRLALDGPLRWKGTRGEVQMVKFGMDYSGRYGGPCRPPRDALAVDVFAEAHRDVQNSIAALSARGRCEEHR
ncbi:dihydrodipicolinate synthase family protein [Lentzea rhizosphaerae]|uniref:Dihydrodipicolinate synthase family protein n=1 Tax=Lentzea rhizosphaerae TaxID=2041025 RepID=A0ABV8C192_9PSEU